MLSHAEASTSGVVPVEGAPDRAGAPRIESTMALSLVRPHRRDDRDRPAEGAPQRIRSLCCEGTCSPGLMQFIERERQMRAAGYTSASARAVESASLIHTQHYFVRESKYGGTVFQTWACTQCGNERIYGADEP